MNSIGGVSIVQPSVSFNAPHIITGKDGRFSLQASPDLSREDVFLVMDVYDLDNSVHPDGHLGWWSFRVDSVGDSLHGKVSIRGNKVTVAMDGMKSFDRWVNANAVKFGRLTISAVLRANTTNAIVRMDRIPVFRNEKDCAAFRAVIPKDWHVPPFADAWFIYPQDATVRIVAPNIVLHDAVGNFCLDVYKLCKQNDIPVEMYAGYRHLALNEVVQRIGRLETDVKPNDTLFYFFSTFDPMFDVIADLPFKRKIGYFHGVTNPRLLQVFDLELSKRCAEAYEQLPGLAGFDRLAANSVASARVVSRTTGRDLAEMQIIPPRIMSTDVHVPVRRRERVKEKGTGPRLLWVGRIKSHKKIEDLIELFAAYHTLDPQAEYWIVGGQSDKAYKSYLDRVVAHHFGAESAPIRWFSNVSDEELSRLYAGADAYVNMSEDEGFCLPLVEAMMAGLPVFAYRLEAVSEVLGQSGIAFHEKDFAGLASSIRDLLANRKRLKRVIERQYERGRHWLAAMDGRGVLSILDPGN
jgi:glycosyltransferase involved in cell wall biosynthesis